jgi:four helix bundle protein
VSVAHHYTELICWQLADRLKVAIYDLAERPQIKNDRSYRDQIRDAAVSATSNIAEGFARGTDPQFLQFLNIARGSLAELQNQLKDGVDRRYVTDEECRELNLLLKRAIGAVAGLQRYLRRSQRRRRHHHT